MIGEPPIIEEEEKVVETPDNLDAGLADEIEMLKMSNALGLENVAQAKQFEDKIQTISKWAKLKGAETIDDAINMIRELSARLGGPREGQTYIKNISEYAYLESERMKIDKQMKVMELK